MDEHEHTVLRCRLCSKPFDKESTLKRHGYYCQSRKAPNPPRTRACVSCIKKKARCDSRKPECTRCKAKGIECHYATKDSTARKPRTDVTASSPKTAEDNAFATTAYDVPSQSNTLATLDKDLTSLDWNALDLDIANFLGSQLDEKASWLTPAMWETAVTPSIPLSPTLNPRSIIRRPKANPTTQRISSLIMHTLKSYIRMLSHNDLPPFIHPSLLSFGDHNMEPLNNCITLLHMIRSDVPGSRKLFWKNVKMECEKLCDEHLRLNKWQLLAAMQALSVYIFIRLDEGETEENNFDSLLLKIVTAISKQLNQLGSHSRICNESLMAWEDWIFWESIRRLCVVYQVVDMLAYFEPAALCDLPHELVLAPLPAKKQRWEAQNEMEWRVESEKEVTAWFGMTSKGELVKMGHGELCWSPSSFETTSNWEEWCSGMDGFGGLVMLAASLIS